MGFPHGLHSSAAAATQGENRLGEGREFAVALAAEESSHGVQAPQDGFMTTAQAAESLQVCEETIRRACRNGRLPHYRTNGRQGHIRIRTRDLEKAFLKKLNGERELATHE